MSPRKKLPNGSLSRKDTKSHAREAVRGALRERPASEFMSMHDYDDVIDRLLAVIYEHGLSEVPLDEIDVARAVRYCCSKGEIQVQHYNREGRELHRIALT